ncbi:MAG: GNAT family N-acetyltransferase [Daejeonella sp.]|uniref:GNAT family N-acetyltransferase n=1 Tax=Daejeonella sp. TaxID=2805397 RepID=UPI003C70A34A
MKVQELKKEDLENCANLIIKAYNGRPWNYQWTFSKAMLYLTELFESSRFVGFVIYERGELVGAMFAHVKTWWIDDQLMIDELFVSAQEQGKGYGQTLMNSTKEYANNNNIGSITLMTQKYMPALSFYEKNSFFKAEQYVLMFLETAGLRAPKDIMPLLLLSAVI